MIPEKIMEIGVCTIFSNFSVTGIAGVTALTGIAFEAQLGIVHRLD
jgi:hypothetical protein